MNYPQYPNQNPQWQQPGPGQPYQQPQQAPSGYPQQAPSGYPQQAPQQNPYAPVPQQPYQQPAGIDPRRMFGGIGQAHISKTGNYERTGRYIARIDAVELTDSKTPGKQDLFLAVDKTVLFVFPGVREAWVQNGSPPDQRPHEVGETCVDLLKQGPSFLGNVKKMINVVCGIPEEQITDDVTIRVFTEKLMVGSFVEMNNFQRMTRRTPSTLYTLRQYVRRVSASEVQQLGIQHGLQQAYAAIFPAGLLDKLVLAEGGTPAPASMSAPQPPPPAPQQPWQQQPQAAPQQQPQGPWQQQPQAAPQQPPQGPWQQPGQAPPVGPAPVNPAWTPQAPQQGR